ncbi:hypothetical protein G9A89_020351 [Geosiphon pyriformis]|nr:hypothetical protein G9A89_020351 [Geosiphon pyriformis]
MSKNGFLQTKSAVISKLPVLNVLKFKQFCNVHNYLLEIWSDCIEVYTDGFLKDTGSIEITYEMAAYFLAADVSVGIRVYRLLSSTLTELQAVALALECVLFLCAVVLYLDSQSAINAYVSETLFAVSDFLKVKKHSEILGNIKANKLVDKTTSFSCSLQVEI